MKQLKTISSIILCVFVLIGCSNQKSSETTQEQSDIEQKTIVSEKQETKNEDFFEIGPIDCYALSYLEDYETTGFGNTDGTLYAKTYNGKEYFFVEVEELNNHKKYPVIKEKSELWGMVFNGKLESDSCTYFVNISTWEPAKRSSDEDNNIDESSEADKQNVTTQKVVVEHQRAPVPVQEYVQCGGCGGSGLCQTCQGNGYIWGIEQKHQCGTCGGFGKCRWCAGQGGHYETRYK